MLRGGKFSQWPWREDGGAMIPDVRRRRELFKTKIVGISALLLASKMVRKGVRKRVCHELETFRVSSHDRVDPVVSELSTI